MMDENVRKMLEEQAVPKNIEALLSDLRKWHKMSRSKMKDRYTPWRNNLRVFQGKRPADEEDIQATYNDEPTKMIVPMSYTQVMTFVTFVYLLLRQNARFYTLDAGQNEEYPLREACESMLDRDLNHNSWSSQVVQFLLDIARMGICASKTVWKQEWQYIKRSTEMPVPVNMGPIGTVSIPDSSPFEKVLKFEGNQIIPVSPFKLLPDMRLPLTRWREGRFVADECEYHIQYLKELQRQGLLAGVNFISKMEKKLFEDSGRVDFIFEQVVDSFTPSKSASSSSSDETDFMCISTEGHYKIVPKDYGLGDEDYAVDFIISVINDQRIVRVERCEYVHGEFVYDIAQFLPDVHAKLNYALSDTIDSLQDVITWLINARILSVRRGLETHAVVDPSVIDTAGMEGRQPIYYVRKGAPRVGIDKFFMQLKYVDPTTTHFNDAENLMRIMQLITGVNDNAMGQVATGRRSATENRAANAGASSRMMVHASIMWQDFFNPLGRKALTNQRQAVSYETFEKVVGKTSPTPGQTTESLFALFQPELKALVGNENFFVWDGTTQTERGYIAQSLQELAIALIGSPEMMPLLQYDINKLIDEIQFYRGVRNVNRFKINETAGQSIIPTPGLGPNGEPVGLPAQVPGQPALPVLPQGVPGGV